MTDDDIIKLKDIDVEDISDILIKMEKSFNFKFDDNVLMTAKTYGNLCDIIYSKLCFENSNDCSTQQAFYKIRSAISSTQLLQKSLILPVTPIEQIFPRIDRRKKVKEFAKTLDLKIDILSMKFWLFCIYFIGFVVSLVTFFFSVKLAFEGLLFFTVVSWISSRFSNEFDLKTIGDLTKILVRENYIKLRANHKAVNKQEVLKLIDDFFINDSYVDKNELYREAPFNWAV